MNKFINYCIVSLLILLLISDIAFSNDISVLKRQIKLCPNNNKECNAKLQNEAETIFKRVGKNFNNDFVAIKNEIIINHCISIIKEIFYSLYKLKAYSNYKDVFLVTKLKKLKDNRDRFDSKRISSDDFQKLNQRAEEQYKHDLKESKEYIDDKVLRLIELCDNLTLNIETMKTDLDMNKRRIPEKLLNKIAELQNDKIWIDFNYDSKSSKKIRKIILNASNNTGKKLIPKLEGIFSNFSIPSACNSLFSKEIILRLIEKHPIN